MSPLTWAVLLAIAAIKVLLIGLAWGLARVRSGWPTATSTHPSWRQRCAWKRERLQIHVRRRLRVDR
jgi:hypothetical protein